MEFSLKSDSEFTFPKIKKKILINKNYSWLKNIVYFLDFIFIMSEEVIELAWEENIASDYSSLNYFESCLNKFLSPNQLGWPWDHRIVLDEDRIKLYSPEARDFVKERDGFFLNIKKLTKENAFNKDWFQHHMEKYYDPSFILKVKKTST